jgi:hypothetical protein
MSVYNRLMDIQAVSIYFQIFLVFEYLNFEEQTCTEKSGYYVSCDKNAMLIILTDLYKFTLYTFSVSSKPTTGGFWSNENTIQVKTSKDSMFMRV